MHIRLFPGYSESVGQRALRCHDWWQVHAETGDLVVEYNSPVGNSQEKRMFKKWQQSKGQENHATYKQAKGDATRTVAVERARAAQELYEKLDTREGEKAIYRLTKSRDQATKYNYQCYFVKAQDGTLLMNTEENISRWAEYFSDLLNKARQHIDGRDEPLTEGPWHEVTCE